MNLLFILLGCHITYLLHDRIQRAVEFANNFNSSSVAITWFLSGGIKNPTIEFITEAEKMGKYIQRFETNATNWTYVYDVNATNTAENFVMANNHLMDYTYDNVYVITSTFHKGRASKIADKMITTPTPIEWILGNAELPDSVYWETIHIKNIEDDIQKAYKFRTHVLHMNI
jgi:uncharacterized SAM-binding protein YcdF (DUF218 family)